MASEIHARQRCGIQVRVAPAMLGLIEIRVTFHDWPTPFLPPDSAQVPSLLYDSRLLKVFWVAVKELKVAYRKVYIYIYEIVGFPQHGNLY